MLNNTLNNSDLNSTKNSTTNWIKNNDCNTTSSHQNVTQKLIVKLSNQEVNPIENGTVLKYVYKKNKNVSVPDKSKGHFKNSLKRRKRSEITNNNKKLAMLLDLNIMNDSKDREELNMPELTPDGIIKSVNLADFNIETLHNNINPLNNFNSSKDKQKHFKVIKSRQFDTKDVKAPKERFYHLESEEIDTSNVSSEEERNKKNIKNNKVSSKHNEDDEKDLPNNSKSEEDFSREHMMTESVESEEKYVENDKPEKKINDKTDEYAPKKLLQVNHKFGENSRETEEDIKDLAVSREDYSNLPTQNTLNNSKVIKDVDLGDFSYENNHRNSDEGLASKNNSQKQFGIDSNVKVTPIEETISTMANSNEQYSVEESNDSIENEKQVNINDGEIRPVVELTKEEDSIEESEENNNEQIKANLNDGYDAKVNSEKIFELEPVIREQDEVNVKQQFERIPLNYNHSAIKSSPLDSTEDSNNNDTEGTLDSLSPIINNKFDDNLNIKFTDLTIKLPEINLPEDILSYAREESESEKNKDKENTKYYNYEDSYEDSKENSETPKKKEEEEEEIDNFYSPYFSLSKDKLQKSTAQDKYDEDNEEDYEDLYEKFVRERFGKSKGRSNKQDLKRKPINSKLYETVQRVIKKTDNIEKEALESRNPDAGYSWTLEYGENL
ncbi:unnamed protein product, partial [Brenthis ino]